MTYYLKVLSESGALSGRPWHLGMAVLVRLAAEPGQQRKKISVLPAGPCYLVHLCQLNNDHNI